METGASNSSTGRYTTRRGKTENERAPPENILSMTFFLSSLSDLCRVLSILSYELQATSYK